MNASKAHSGNPVSARNVEASGARARTGRGGRTIYSRTASFGEWIDTDRRFVIEQEGDEFIVTDSLPDFTPSPLIIFILRN